MQLNKNQIKMLEKQLLYSKENSSLYKEKYANINLENTLSQQAFENLPFTEKSELREGYPLGIMAAKEEDVVRIHSSSGTTGQPIIIPYTKKDVDHWAMMFERCYIMAGMTNKDRIQITPGYGLWTAGIGFQTGAEKLGAMVIPMGPGNTEKQLQMMQDLKTTVITGTSSYTLLLAEEVAKRGIKEKIHLKKGIIGSERWGDKMRERIINELGIEIFDIYGLTEIYGPGIGIDCKCHNGMHYWDDFVYFEILNPNTLKPVEDGQLGELCITTLCKEGAPLIRYRTHDLTRIIPQKCECGSSFPKLDRIVGRTDDMVKVKGVNIYPGQIDELLGSVMGISSEYRVTITHVGLKDEVLLEFEMERGCEPVAFTNVEREVEEFFKGRIGIKIKAKGCVLGTLPRSEKKSQRIIDKRFE